MLKSSGFRQQRLEQKPVAYTPVPEHLRRGAMAPVAGIPASAIEKEAPARSEPYRVASKAAFGEFAKAST